MCTASKRAEYGARKMLDLKTTAQTTTKLHDTNLQFYTTWNRMDHLVYHMKKWNVWQLLSSIS